MSSAKRFKCTNCHHEIVAWSDYDNYFIDSEGHKQYTYHPSHDALEKCIGYESPCLCLSCGELFSVDSLEPTNSCPKCSSSEINELYDIDDKNCPYCNLGKFHVDDRFFMVS